MTDVDRVRKLIVSLNEAWQAGQFEQLAGYYHPEVVLLPPDAGAPMVGREAVIASYREFANTATLYEFQITSLDVFTFDGASVCHMRFEIEYKIDGGRFRESGLEIYVVTNVTGGPTQPEIIWRSQTVLDVEEVLPESSPR